MPEVSLADWNQFISKHSDAHLLQMGEWGELKNNFGWKPVRLILNNEIGAQILFRRLPLGLTLGYMPKPAFSFQQSAISDAFWKEVDSVCEKNHAVFLKVGPDAWTEEFIIHHSSFIIFSLSPFRFPA
jgi:lipid II:glycine glycyltransferase (peptidoglycan interpeptide bridge formation enzyme)